MAAINMGSIMSKVKTWSESPEGKLRIKEKIEQYRRDDVRKTAGGGNIVTYAMMRDAAKRFIDILQDIALKALQDAAQDTAREYDSRSSVIQHFYNLNHSEPQQLPDGSTVIFVYFGGDLRRESLENEDGGRTGEGINNIVALFNNGAHASDYVYGWWNNHSPTGEALARSAPGDSFAWVRSRKDREALHFIQQAVSDFNNDYGTDFNVTAVAGDDYQS